MKKLTLITISLVFYVSSSFGQCTYQVTHLDGSQSVNGVMVTVTSEGYFDYNSGYCPATKPYLIGATYESMLSGKGSYSFIFSPPVSMLTLNFSGLSAPEGHYELVRLFVNGVHYSIPSPGTLNGCDDMAILTPEGDIAPCPGCILSGWKGTSIDGPIYSLKVQDTVLEGNPGGAIFSLFICDSIPVGFHDNKITEKYHFSPSPLVNQSSLNFPPVKQKAVFTLFNLNGQLVKTVDNVQDGQVLINRDGLPSGIYSFVVKTESQIIANGKLVIE